MHSRFHLAGFYMSGARNIYSYSLRVLSSKHQKIRGGNILVWEPLKFDQDYKLERNIVVRFE